MEAVSQCNLCKQHSLKAGEHCLAVKRQLRKWLKGGEVLHFKKGQVLFYEGHQPFGFFLISEGAVVPTPLEDKTMGLFHLLTDTPYCSTCTAASDLSALFFPKAFVFAHLKPAK